MSDNARFLDLWNDYLEGDLDESGLVELRARMAADEHLLRMAVESYRTHRLLGLLAQNRESVQDAFVRETLDRLPLDGKRFTDAVMRSLSPRWVGKSRMRLVGWSVACASLVIVAAFAFLVSRQDAPNRPPANGIARLIATVDASWSGVEPIPGKLLGGGLLKLNQGTAELELDDGARVVVRGPARFEFISANHLHLRSGRLIARIPEEALGFTVTTPHTEVVDLGTEFALDVGDDDRTDVHVLDGLVEVLRPRAHEMHAEERIMIAEGQARRLNTVNGYAVQEIPVTSRDAFLDGEGWRKLGLELLRGSVRLRNDLPPEGLARGSSGQHWIDVIPERRGITLSGPTDVTLVDPGDYLRFDGPSQVLPAGLRVDCFLLHFRPTEHEPVRGVIKFARPIVGILCTRSQLDATDAVFGLENVDYPAGLPGRGVGPTLAEGQRAVDPRHREPLAPDRITLSESRRTLSLKMMAYTGGGIDQIRVLTLSDK